MFWNFVSNILVYILIVLLLFYVIRKQQKGKGGNNLLYIVLLPVFIWLGTYAYCTGDYVHYRDIIERLGINIEMNTHIERYYIALVELTDADYEIWRLVIYVLIFLLMYQAFWLAKRSDYYTLLWFSVLMLPEAMNAIRTTLAFWAFMVGLLYLNSGGKKVIISVIYFWIAVEAHKSIAPLLLLLPFSFVKLNRGTMYFLCLLVPIFSFLLEGTVLSFLDSHDLVEKEGVSRYSTYNRGMMTSIGSTIEFFLYRIPYIWLCLVLVLRLIKHSNPIKSVGFIRLNNFTMAFILFLLAALFLFGYNNPMYYRYETFIWYFFLMFSPYLYPDQYYLRKRKYWLLPCYLLFVQVYRLSLMGYYESFKY